MGEKMTLEQVIRRAYLLGQTYWQQADSESYSQNKKADKTEERFNILLQEALTTPAQTVDIEAVREVINELDYYCSTSDEHGYGTLLTKLVQDYTNKLSQAIGDKT